jgi:preprotein translocase subunit SecE
MESYKAGQGSLARLTTWVAVLIALALGCAELYTWIQDPIEDTSLIPGVALFEDLPFFGTKFSWKFLLCTLLFAAGIWLSSRLLTKKTTVDALIETEQELRKVSWPTREESINATGVVILVSVLLTIALFSFDLLFNQVFSLIF